MLRRLLAHAFWAVIPWKFVSEPAPQQPAVILGAPHTSNWDFAFMLGIAWRLGIPLRWLGKHTLFTSWRGPLMRALGGIPVDRRDPSQVVVEIVARLEAGERFFLVVTPEGTRGRSEYWRSGFYRIAREADLPITLGYVDRRTMTTGLGPTFRLTGDVGADMDRVRGFYAGKTGVRPGLGTVPRLREED